MDVTPRAGHDRRGRSRTGPGRQAAAVAAGLVALLVGSLLVLLAEAGAAARASADLVDGPVVVAGAARDLRAAVQREVLEARTAVLAGPAAVPPGGAVAGADALVRRIGRGSADPVVRARLDALAVTRREVRDVVAAASGGDLAPGSAASRLTALDARQQALLGDVVARLEADVRAAAARRAEASARRQQVVALVVTSGVALLLVALAAVAVRVARPVRRVTAAAHDAAERTLPSLAVRVADMPVGGQRPRVEPVEVGPRDAFPALAEAVTALQDTAVRLLVEQHEAQRGNVDLLLDLARRSDQLLDGVLLDVAGLRRATDDPDDATTLDGVADAAARVRRDLAAVLALAGAAPAAIAHEPRVVDLREPGALRVGA